MPLHLRDDLLKIGVKKIYNEYGPTETTVFSSLADVTNCSEIHIGKPIGNMKQRKEDHELIVKNSKAIRDLSRKHIDDTNEAIKCDEEIKGELKRLTNMFIDKEINDYRWEIINFATKVSEGKPCNRDSYKHCFRTYEKYERLLKENGLENGEVEISMEIINESYKDKLQEGF